MQLVGTAGIRRYVILDAYRGIAAFAVLLYHIGAPLKIECLASHAYLAVDFFFLLSGFVLDRAYSPRLQYSSFKPEFLLRRLARLWPMIALGTLLGAVVTIGSIWKGRPLDLGELLLALAFGLSLLPFGRMPPSELIFPLNGPLWSLFYEMVVNGVYCLAFRWLRAAVLLVVIAATAVGLIFVASAKGDLDIGGGTGAYLAGAFRVGFSFFMGVLLSRIKAPFDFRPGIAAILPAVLICLLVTPLPQHPLYDLACVLVAFPFLIFVSAEISPPPFWERPCELMGELSYPLYAIHYPIMRVFQYVQETRAMSGATLATSVVVEIFVCLGAAYLATKFVDRPARDGLTFWARSAFSPRTTSLTP